MFKNFRVLRCVCGLLSALAGPANAVNYTIDSGGGVAPVYSTLENLRSALGGVLNDGDSITFLNSDATLTGEFTLAGGFSYWWDSGLRPSKATPWLFIWGALTLASQAGNLLRAVFEGEGGTEWPGRR